MKKTALFLTTLLCACGNSQSDHVDQTRPTIERVEAQNGVMADTMTVSKAVSKSARPQSFAGASASASASAPVPPPNLSVIHI